MKPMVFALTGFTGEQFVRQALAVDREVTAVARRPDAVAPADTSLRLLVGDVPDPASLRVGVVRFGTEPGLNKQQPYVV
jgi:uncharacterized protein YbjT (DUF2867 family)